MQHAQTELVAAVVQSLAADLFRAHIAVLAFELARTSVAGPVRLFGNPKIDQFDLSIVSEQDILRTDISMDDSDGLAVGINSRPAPFEGAGDRCDDPSDHWE